MISWFNVKDELIYIGNSYFLKKDNKYQLIFDAVRENYNLKVNKLLRIEACITNMDFSENRYFFGKGNVLITGEAAGLLYNYSIGIPSALESGKKAGEAIISAKYENQNVNKIYSENILEEKGCLLCY